ncbi:MAG: hypothetical protein ACYC4K_10405 [Thiobacillus sp.]
MKLKDYIKSITKEQREEFASMSGTSVGYLYLLAGSHRTPSMSMARRLQKASNGRVSLNDWDTQTNKLNTGS